jgi:hypothetical protein
MYVDASGDDGIKFEKDSSLMYVVSCILMEREDVPHNMSILSQIKRLMGAKEKDEVKYSKVHRHPKRDVIHDLLKETQGYLFSMVVFKKEILDKTYLENLGGLSHAISIRFISDMSKEIGDSLVSIIVDRMKQTEMSSVRMLLKHLNAKDSESHPLPKVEFKDSKAVGFELIQLADIFAGLTRRYFENTLNDPDIQTMNRLCPLCSSKKVLCRNRKITRQKALNSHYFSNILHLYKNTERHTLSLYVNPANITRRYWYMTCTKK